MIEENTYEDALSSSFHEVDISDQESNESFELPKQKKIAKKLDSGKISQENSEKEISDDSADEEDDTDEMLLRIGTKTVKKTALANKSKKIQKIDFNVYDFLLGWRKSMKSSLQPDDAKSYKQICANNLNELKLDEYAESLQALYININWKTEDSLNGKSIDDLKKLQLSSKLINNGIIFIWSEKELINDIISILEEKNFIYIENFAVILLNPKLKESSHAFTQSNKENDPPKPKLQNSLITSFFKLQTKNEAAMKVSNQSDAPTKNQDIVKQVLKNEDYCSLMDIDPRQLLDNRTSEFFYKSKKILMMFRRNEKNSQPLELRHQRTSDVVFDLSTKDAAWKINDYVYKMIETLLPNALYEKNMSNEDNLKFKMMELYANADCQRKGWISISELTN